VASDPNGQNQAREGATVVVLAALIPAFFALGAVASVVLDVPVLLGIGGMLAGVAATLLARKESPGIAATGRSTDGNPVRNHLALVKKGADQAGWSKSLATWVLLGLWSIPVAGFVSVLVLSFVDLIFGG
jgi:hypothetical protein